jgi:hypothetical protein
VNRDSGTASANGGWLRRLVRRIGQSHNKSSYLNLLCSVWRLNVGSLNIWVSGLEGAEGEFGAASSADNGVFGGAGDGHHDKIAGSTPVTSLAIALGFGFGSGHPNRQRPVGNIVGVGSGGHDIGGTTGDKYARNKCDGADNIA